jgi:hypothetical protein
MFRYLGSILVIKFIIVLCKYVYIIHKSYKFKVAGKKCKPILCLRQHDILVSVCSVSRRLPRQLERSRLLSKQWIRHRIHDAR